MVVAGHPLAARAGAEVLRQGGNAVDAAVAAALTLWVVEPHGSGLGGEGSLVAWLEREKKCITIDFGSRAPLDARIGDYQNRGERRRGPKSAGVPGVLAGLSLFLERYGTKSLEEIAGPAIHYAEGGFPVDPVLARALRVNRAALLKYPSSRSIFASRSEVLQEGGRLVQKELAFTLRKIIRDGVDSFYRGEVAEIIEKNLLSQGGKITKKDLASYSAREVSPIKGSYRGYEICTSFPPAGGITLVEMLNLLEGYDLRSVGADSSLFLHLLAEAIKLADKDRRREVADPRFVPVPIERLTDKKSTAELRKLIQEGKTRDVTAGKKVEEEDPWQEGSTTHLSVVDRWGNGVALTQTLSFLFGSGFVIPGTGILLNNDMNNFSYRKGQANTMAPGKSPRVSRSPTILLREGRPVLLLGSPGAGRIIPTVAQVIVHLLDHGMDLERAVAAPRLYTREGYPIDLEEGLPSKTAQGLAARGHGIRLKGKLNPFFGGVHAIAWDTRENGWRGAADPRRYGAVAKE
jgi:gamma-glutamyltranspeptidase/glutathione hydrolase